MAWTASLSRRGGSLLVAVTLANTTARESAAQPSAATGVAVTTEAETATHPGTPTSGENGPAPVEQSGSPGSFAGPAVDPEQAKQAQQDTEGSAPLPVDSKLPRRMPAMETAAWWTLFGAVALATTGGVLAGISEREEDRALAIATEVDPETGMQPLYEDKRDAYERALERGERFQWAAWGVLATSAATVIVSVVLFAVHTRRNRTGHLTARLLPNAIGVRF